MSDVQILRQVLLEVGRDVSEQVIAEWSIRERLAADRWARARRIVDAGHILNAFCMGHEGNAEGLRFDCICVPPRPEFIDRQERDPFEMAV